jgi:hypothetical protein
MSFSALTSLFKIFDILKGGNIPGKQKTYSEESIFQDNVIANENHLTGGNSVTLGQTIKTGSVFLIKNPFDIIPVIPSLFASGGILAGFSTLLHTGLSMSVGSMTYIGDVNLFGSVKINGKDLEAELALGKSLPSDENLKENIETIQEPLKKVSALRGVTFDFKENKQKQIGVIAQEVEEIIPEVVVNRPDGYKGVQYGNLVGLLIEAIKEQQEQINQLKATVEELKNGVG